MKNVVQMNESQLREFIRNEIGAQISAIKESVRLGFPLDERVNMENYESKSNVISINETNARRMLDRHGESGYIVISPCRGCDDFGISKTDPNWKIQLKNANQPRIREFVKDLKATGYSYTPVYGGFIENFGTDNAENVYERSFMVYANRKGQADVDLKGLYDFGLAMAKKFNQDSFLFKAPGEKPKYITKNGETDMEFDGDAAFNDFAQEYFTDLHKNSEKHAGKEDGRPTRFTFLEAYVNPTSGNVAARAPRHYKGEIFID